MVKWAVLLFWLIYSPWLLVQINAVQMLAPPSPQSSDSQGAKWKLIHCQSPAPDKDLFSENCSCWSEAKMLIGTSCINSLSGGQQLPHHWRKPEESPLPFCSKKPPSRILQFLLFAIILAPLKQGMKDTVIWTLNMGCCLNFLWVALSVQLFFFKCQPQVCLLPVYCCIFYLNTVFTLAVVCVYIINVEMRLPNLFFF